MAQPCEWCGKTRASSLKSKKDDAFMRARRGSKSDLLGYEFERLCGSCNAIPEITRAWENHPLNKAETGS